MEEGPSKKNGRWLYVFGLIYLILLLIMQPEQQPMAQVRWIGFFHTDAGTYPSHLPPVPLFKAHKP